MLKDTELEVEELQNRLWMQKTPQERAEFAARMFDAGREAVISSLPQGLSRRDMLKQLYLRTYGEPLVEEFFEGLEY